MTNKELKIKIFEYSIKGKSLNDVVEWRSTSNIYGQRPEKNRSINDIKQDLQKIYKPVLQGTLYPLSNKWSVLNDYDKLSNEGKKSEIDAKVAKVIEEKLKTTEEDASVLAKSLFNFKSSHVYNWNGANGDIHEAFSVWAKGQRASGKPVSTYSPLQYIKGETGSYWQSFIKDSLGNPIGELNFHHFVNTGHWTSTMGKAGDRKALANEESRRLINVFLVGLRYEAKHLNKEVVKECFDFRKYVRVGANRWNTMFAPSGFSVVDHIFEVGTIKGYEAAGSFREVKKVAGTNTFVELRPPKNIKNYKASDFIE